MEADEAKMWCETHNGASLKITSQEQYNRTVKLLQDEHPEKMVWLGANDQATEGTWVWADNSGIEFNRWLEVGLSHGGNVFRPG